MCGIVYYKSLKGYPVNKAVLKRFKAQRNRGVQGFGFYLPKQNTLTHNTREQRIISLLKRQPAAEVLFHHRYPTSTDNVRNACHPFSTHDHFKHNYVLVHNGVVINQYALQNEHDKHGIMYISEQDNGAFNDSEALLYDIALTLTGKQKEMKAKGDIAFIMVENDKQGKPVALHFGRNAGSPLMLSFTKKELSLASEGKGNPIKTDTLYTYTYATGKLTTRPFTIPEYVWVSTGYSTPGQANGSADDYKYSGYGTFALPSASSSAAQPFEQTPSANPRVTTAQIDAELAELKTWGISVDSQEDYTQYLIKELQQAMRQIDTKWDAAEDDANALTAVIDEYQDLQDELDLQQAVLNRLQAQLFFMATAEENNVLDGSKPIVTEQTSLLSLPTKPIPIGVQA